MLKVLIEAEKKKTKEALVDLDKATKDKKLGEVEKKTLQESYEKLKKEMEKMLDSDKLQRQVLENEIKEMRATIHEQREKINTLDSKLLEHEKVKETAVDESEIERLRQDNNNLLDELRRNMEEIMKLEELEHLIPKLKEKDREIKNLQDDITLYQEKLSQKDRELEGEDKRIENLHIGLIKAGSHQDKLQHTNEYLLKEKKDLIERLKKKDLLLEEKGQEIQKSIDALEVVKNSSKKLKLQIDKISKERDDLTKRLDKVLSDFVAMKRSKEEIQVVLDKLQQEFLGYKETLAKKDEWILKQANEMKLIAEQHASLKKKHLDYKLEMDLGKQF
jgi:chromosome segregation ATPase